MTLLKTEAGNAGISSLQFDRTTSPDDLQMLAYQESSGKFVFKDPFFIDPADGRWGEVGSSVDSTPAFQAAVNFAITGSTTDTAGASLPITRRTARWPIKISRGTYRLDSKLKIYSVVGLSFAGSGSNSTLLKPGTLSQDHVIDVQGAFDSVFRDFGATLDTTGTCTSFMNVDAQSSITNGGSGENNLFENIFIGNGLSYIHGVTIGALGASNAQDAAHQVFRNVGVRGSQRIALNFTATTTSASTSITSVSNTTATSAGIRNGDTIEGNGIPAGTTVVSGQGTSTLVLSQAATANAVGIGLQRAGWDSSATYWQNGFKIGGAFGQGNVLQFVFDGCQNQGHVNGVYVTATNVHWRGGWLIANHTDIRYEGGGVHIPCIFEGFRGESSGRLLETSSTSIASQLVLRDIGWSANVVRPDGFWVRWLHGGVFRMENVEMSGVQANRALQPQIRVGTSGGAQMVRISDCVIETITGTPEPISAWLTESGTGRRGTWVVEGIASPVTGGNATYASGVAADKPLAGPCSNRDRIAPLMTFSATATNGSPTLTSGNSTASAQVRIGQTVTGPNIPAATTITAVSGNTWTMSANATGSGTATHALIAYTVDPSDQYVGVASTTTGGCTVNLPAVANVHPGYELVVKDESGTANTNNIVIDGSGAETIEGAATNTISTNYGSRRLKSTGTAWVLV